MVIISARIMIWGRISRETFLMDVSESKAWATIALNREGFVLYCLMWMCCIWLEVDDEHILIRSCPEPILGKSIALHEEYYDVSMMKYGLNVCYCIIYQKTYYTTIKLIYGTDKLESVYYTSTGKKFIDRNIRFRNHRKQPSKAFNKHNILPFKHPNIFSRVISYSRRTIQPFGMAVITTIPSYTTTTGRELYYRNGH